MEVQLHILTCRPLDKLEYLLAEAIQRERCPSSLRNHKVLSPAVVLDMEEKRINLDVESFTFSDWLDLDTYFREWLVHQRSEKSD